MEKKQKLLLYSRLALYPMHWQAFRIMCEQHNVEPYILTTAYNDMSGGHKMLGWTDVESEKKSGFEPKIYYVPQGSGLKKVFFIFKYLHSIKPNIVWAQEEPHSPFLTPLLMYYFFDRKPKIVGAVTENIFFITGIKKVLYNFLWKRLDGLLGAASESIQSICAVGMPLYIPATPLIAGCLSPKENVVAMEIPLSKKEGDFFVGYVGRLCEEKGWKVVVDALRILPEHFKCVVAGSGVQVDDLKKMMEEPILKGRIYYAGLLPKDELWRFYKTMDCLAVPSLTTKTWKEQFGGVLADAMAVGIPIVGSDSGAIPEVIGPAGIIVRENNPKALSEALKTLYNDAGLRKSLSESGKKRFAEEFSVSAYARKIAIGLGLSH